MTNIHLQQVIAEQERALNSSQRDCVREYGPTVYENAPPVFNYTTKSYMCPPFWDKILCWPPTPAGVLATQNCPPYFTGFLPFGSATRQCMENGSWFRGKNATWTNYTQCFNESYTVVLIDLNRTYIPEVLEHYIPVVQVISKAGYIVSFATLIIAFAIMLFIKKLHCARNILHMHLFASFIFRALTFIVIESTFVEGIGLASDLYYRNGSLYFDINTEVLNFLLLINSVSPVKLAKTNNWTCKFITSLWQYFLTANYSWILMEGLYLHNLIFRALFADSSNSIKWYVIMGWGLPKVIIGAWVTARVLFEDSLCWTTHENYGIFLIIGIPTMISILLNLCLFMRISVVLYSKLRSPINEDSRRYRKWAKSTLVLMPLFGVHYALFLSLYFLSRSNKVVEVVWLFCDRLFGSFQGFFVAILYCFLNGEVKSEIQPHMYYFLTFLATNKYSKFLFPCRKKFLRSVVGRSSVCTTMSCSSLYTNGVLHRNSKCRLDNIPKLRPGDKAKEHICQNASRRNSRSQRHSQPFNFSFNVPTSETTLCIEQPSKKRLETEGNEETLKMVNNDF